MTNEAGHPDLAALDALRAGEEAPEAARHVETCPECRAELDDLRSLAAEIRAIAPGPPQIPAAVDEAILAAARRPRRRMWAPLAAAAAALIAVTAVLVIVNQGPLANLMAGGDPYDVDESGAVDILDAYTLAVRVRTGEPIDSAWDINNDGVIDMKDVDEIARESVSLARRGG